MSLFVDKYIYIYIHVYYEANLKLVNICNTCNTFEIMYYIKHNEKKNKKCKVQAILLYNDNILCFLVILFLSRAKVNGIVDSQHHGGIIQSIEGQ